MTKWMWLRKLCAGIIDDVIIDKTKLDDMMDCLSEIGNQSVVIWAVYREEIRIIYQYLQSMKKKVVWADGTMAPLKREEARKSFMAGEAQYFVVNPYAFRFGADFSQAYAAIYYSLPVSGLTYAQSEARPIDLNLSNDLLVIYLLREKSIEVDLHKSLLLKENTQSSIRRIVTGIQRRKGYIK
jgi:hypothetical protein